jgi:hypothetical protein
MDPSSTGGKMKLGPFPSSIGSKLNLGPPPSLLNGRQGQAWSTPPPSTGGKVKLGPSPSSGGQIFRAYSSWHAKKVEVINLISSSEDTNHGYEDRYDVDNNDEDGDDEDSDNVLLCPPSSPECHKQKAPDVTDCTNKKVISMHYNQSAMSLLLTC